MLSLKRVKELLSYDPETGLFEWRFGRPGCSEGPAGSTEPRGYVTITVERHRFWAHRLAFLYMVGKLPDDGVDVDHINRNKSDNRWTNLRLTTRRQNLANSGLRVNNTSGFKGVTWNPKLNKWQARIRTASGRLYLGSFSEPSEAGKAYADASIRINGV